MSKTGSISMDEAKNLKVARWIDGREGFKVDRRYLQESVWLDIERPVVNSLFFFEWISATVVAKLHLEKPTNWVMNVYGRAVLEQCRTLAEALAQEFNTHVHVKLVQES